MTARFSEKQREHLKRMREKRPVDWRNTNGAPTKEHIVKEYQRTHPGATKYKCHIDTGISPNTVSKWWDNNIIRKEE